MQREWLPFVSLCGICGDVINPLTFYSISRSPISNLILLLASLLHCDDRYRSHSTLSLPDSSAEFQYRSDYYVSLIFSMIAVHFHVPSAICVDCVDKRESINDLIKLINFQLFICHSFNVCSSKLWYSMQNWRFSFMPKSNSTRICPNFAHLAALMLDPAKMSN